MWLHETHFSDASHSHRLSRMRLALLFAIVCAAASGCVMVRAHQREHLAKRSMTNDVEMGEGRFDSHARGAREGAEGGTNHPGGGCGCN